MNKVHFFYPKGRKLTGQEMASRLILSNVAEVDFRVYTFPAFERGRKNPFYLLMYILKVICSWFKILILIFSSKPVIYANLGQTKMSLLRDAQPLKILSWFKSYSLVVSLHGHVFTTWTGEESVCRLFISILEKAQVVTVLGEVQKQKLIDLGIAAENVVIVPNTCELPIFDAEKNKETVNLLYLSNLIEDKGYLEYLESLKVLSESQLTKNIHAVLCGNLYEGELDKSAEIDELINTVNNSGNISVEWMKGAYGEEKEKLFKKTDIFIFPSKYKVEAQPIVLIEAMASGCAVITTKVGEIPSTVSDDCAVLLDKASPNDISAAVITFLGDGSMLKSKQTAAQKRFTEKFSLDIYKKNWVDIFKNLSE